MGFSISGPHGRLLITSIVTPTTADEASKLAMDVGKLAARISNGVIFATDFSRLTIMSPEVAEAYIQLMKRDNKVMQRAGLLVQGGGPTLQLQRLVKESGVNTRRVFTEPLCLVRWLSEVTRPEELAVLARHFKIDAAAVKAG